MGLPSPPPGRIFRTKFGHQPPRHSSRPPATGDERDRGREHIMSSISAGSGGKDMTRTSLQDKVSHEKYQVRRTHSEHRTSATLSVICGALGYERLSSPDESWPLAGWFSIRSWRAASMSSSGGVIRSMNFRGTSPPGPGSAFSTAG